MFGTIEIGHLSELFQESKWIGENLENMIRVDFEFFPLGFRYQQVDVGTIHDFSKLRRKYFLNCSKTMLIFSSSRGS